MELCPIIQPLLDYVVKPVCSFAKKHISFVVCKSKLAEDLIVERENLEVKKREINMRVSTARSCKDIVPEVSNWLRDAGTLIEEVNRYLEREELNSDNKCGFNRCFCSVANRYKTGKEATNLLKMLKKKLKETSEPCFIEVGIPRHSPPAPMALLPTSYYKGYASREFLLEEIIEALKVKNMIGIHGMPGVGKTVLVNRLAAEVKSLNLFDEVGIAVVSQTPDLAVIRNVIADRILREDLRGNSEEGKKDDLCRQLSELMKEQKTVLLVLDNAWEPLELHEVGIPWPTKWLKIVVTSRSRQVCTRMRAEGIFEVHVLDKEEAWSLFRKELEEYSERYSDEGYKEFAEEMLEHFNGLPLALVTLARALAVEKLRGWEDIAQFLRERPIHEIDGMSDKVIGAIEASFNYLRDKDAQYIFLLCCLLSEDRSVEVEVLVRSVIGLGLFGNVTPVHATDRVKRLIEGLKSQSLLIEGSRGSSLEGKTVRMHDVIRDAGLHIASKGEFDFLVKDYRASRIDALSHDKLIEKTAISISSKTSIKDFFPQDHMMEYPNLQILCQHGIRDNDNEDFVPHEFSACFFKGMGNLKVLEMRHAKISSFPTSLSSLKNNLRTLCLRHCVIKDFTNGGELTNLEILDMKGSRIHSGLCEAIQQMIGLRVLDLTSCRANELFDNLVGHLSQLEALYMLDMANMDASKPNITSPVELALLSRLEVLEVQVGSPEQLTNSFFTFLGKLSSFHIWVSEQLIKVNTPYDIHENRSVDKVLKFKNVTINEHLQQCLGQLVRVADTFQFVVRGLTKKKRKN